MFLIGYLDPESGTWLWFKVPETNDWNTNLSGKIPFYDSKIDKMIILQSSTQVNSKQRRSIIKLLEKW